MISFLAEVIGIRDDIYLGEGNRYMREVAAALQEGYEQGVLPQRPAVINLQCDIDHPTQTLADLLHLEQPLRRARRRCAAGSSSSPGPIRRATASRCPCPRA